MLKMFSTQLTGLFKRIHDQGEFAFEDGARLLAQAAVCDGAIFVYGANEMEAIVLEAISGAEPLKFGQAFPVDVAVIQPADRVLIVSRFSDELEAVSVAQMLNEKEVPFIAMATRVGGDGDGPDLADLADVFLDLQLKKGLLPTETGERFGMPTAMAGLFAYYGLKFTLDEILAEYDEE